MQCPKCNGDVWDNRQKKVAGQMKPNAPDFSCKNKESCGWVQWPPKGAKPATPSVDAQGPIASPGAPQPQPGPSSKQAQLVGLYWECFDEVLAGIARRKLTDMFKPEHLAAMTSTLYIQLAKSL